MWITRLKLVNINTENPQVIARVQTARGASKRSMPTLIVRDAATGYRTIDKEALRKHLERHVTTENVPSEQRDGGTQ